MQIFQIFNFCLAVWILSARIISGRQYVKHDFHSSAEGDDDIHIKLQALVDSDGQGTHIECHKTCYCSYTSKQNVVKYMAKIRKEGFSSPGTEPPVTRVRRSQLPTFQLKKHCLPCGNECIPKYPKHPDRWERVVECETGDGPGHTSFKYLLLDTCEQRND